MDYAVPAVHWVKIKENENRDNYLNLARELKKKKAVEHEGNSDTNYNWCTWNGPQRLGKEDGRVRNQRTSRNYPNYRIVEVGPNTERSDGDLLSLRLQWKATR